MQKNLTNCRISATVTDIQPLNHHIVELAITHQGELNYRAGQFVALASHDGLTSRYSITTPFSDDNTIRLHVARSKACPFSLWVHDQLTIGETIQIDLPQGECFYRPGNPEEPLLLIGNDCCLAPLAGILHDAFKHQHTGLIDLFHSPNDKNGVYWVSEMAELMQKHPNFSYFPCTPEGDIPPGHTVGEAHSVAIDSLSDLSLQGMQVFLCGSTEMINQAKKAVHDAGAVEEDIHTQVFGQHYQDAPSC